MLQVFLFTRDGCHLCGDVRDTLHDLSRRYPHQAKEVDITGDPALFAHYRFSIPVVEIGDRKLAAPIEPRQLEKALRQATREEENATP